MSNAMDRRLSASGWLAGTGAVLLAVGEGVVLAEDGVVVAPTHLLIALAAGALAGCWLWHGRLSAAWRRAGEVKRAWWSALLGVAAFALFVAVLFAHLDRDLDQEALLAMGGALLIELAVLRLEP